MKKTILSGLAGLLLGCNEDHLSIGTDIKDKPAIEYEILEDTTYEQILRTQKFFSTFPTTIPGAKKIKKYEIDSAKYVLIHIRQVHHDNHLETEKQHRYINLVQEEIHTILSYFADEKITQIAYSEGRTIEDAKMITELYAMNREINLLAQKTDFVISIFYEMNLIELNEKKKTEKYDEVEQRIQYETTLFSWQNDYRDLQKMKQEDVERVFARSGALEKLAKEGIFEMKGSEEEDANIRAGIALERGETKSRYVMDDREDIAISIIAENRQQTNILVFGYAHDFYDNILRWNQIHPDEKFAFIEITPFSVPKTNDEVPEELQFHVEDLHLLN